MSLAITTTTTTTSAAALKSNWPTSLTNNYEQSEKTLTHTHTEGRAKTSLLWPLVSINSIKRRVSKGWGRAGEGGWYATGDSLSNYWDCNFGLAIASNRIFWQAARNWKLNCRSMTMSKVKEKRERSETAENEAHSRVATVNGKSEKEAVHLSVNDLIQLHCEPSSRLLKSLSILGFYGALSHGQQIAVDCCEIAWKRFLISDKLQSIVVKS